MIMGQQFIIPIDCLTSLTLFAVFSLLIAEAQKPVGFTCQTPHKKIGRCINIKECTDLLWLLTNKKNEPMVMNFLRESQCGYENNTPKVCCKSYNPTVVSSTQTPFPKYAECGINEITHRIIAGNQSQAGEYPWMTALGYRRDTDPGPEWYCGGALITENYVLTAAHCVSGISPWELYIVRIGDVNLNDGMDDGATPVDVRIQQTKIHEQYSSSPVMNDIALIKLRRKVQFTPLIKPICLPENVNFHQNILDNEFGYVAGWGRTSIDGPFSPILLDLKIPILNIDICKKAYQSRPGSQVDNRNLCAGYLSGGKDSCQGDSGGPLMWTNQSDSRFYAVGIVSYGMKCAERGYPGVYTRVSEYIDWISSNIS